MSVAALICEYNPFHNGHKYQIDKIKKECDSLICIMSGSFVQRGDVAILDKWTRTKQALLNEADLVLELPVIYSLNTAEKFALGGVEIAESLGIVDSLYFGSECGDIKKLKNSAFLLENEPEDVSQKIKEYLNNGENHAKARMMAFSDIIPCEILTEPNNILALEYIKALNSISSKITPKTIKREFCGYHDLETKGEIASATAIRNKIFDNKDFFDFIPDNTKNLYKDIDFFKTDKLSDILLYTIRVKSAEELSKISGVNEGLENRIKEAILHSKNFDEVCEYVKSKRYTMSKIRRTMLSIILGIEKEFENSHPEYIRVLGMNKNGISLLSKIKKTSNLPIITKTADYKENSKMFLMDIKATDIFYLSSHTPLVGADFKTSPVVM